MSGERRSALAAGAGAAAGLAALALTGRALPMPVDLRPSALAEWVRAVGPATAAFTGLRAVAVVLLAWWVLTGLAGVVARRARRPRLVGALDRLAPLFVRRLAEAVAGVGVVGAVLAPAVGAGAAPPPAAMVTMIDAGPAMTDLGPLEPSPAPAPTPTSPPVPTSTSAPPGTSAAPAQPAPLPPPPPSPPPSSGAAGPAPAGRTWVIAPGDTLWHVAEATAAVRLDRAPTPAEVVRALDELVALNVGRLAVPDDPGLVFPGQEFVLP